ncbi:SDR family NAD(P)-dependent oxidoreductase [Nocardia asteroides]
MGGVAYSAARAGVRGLSISMMHDLIRYGVRVNVVRPEATWSDGR